MLLPSTLPGSSQTVAGGKAQQTEGRGEPEGVGERGGDAGLGLLLLPGAGPAPSSRSSSSAKKSGEKGNLMEVGSICPSAIKLS